MATYLLGLKSRARWSQPPGRKSRGNLAGNKSHHHRGKGRAACVRALVYQHSSRVVRCQRSRISGLAHFSRSVPEPRETCTNCRTRSSSDNLQCDLLCNQSNPSFPSRLPIFRQSLARVQSPQTAYVPSLVQEPMASVGWRRGMLRGRRSRLLLTRAHHGMQRIYMQARGAGTTRGRMKSPEN